MKNVIVNTDINAVTKIYESLNVSSQAGSVDAVKVAVQKLQAHSEWGS
jgi:hypothetical protein